MLKILEGDQMEKKSETLSQDDSEEEKINLILQNDRAILALDALDLDLDFDLFVKVETVLGNYKPFYDDYMLLINSIPKYNREKWSKYHYLTDYVLLAKLPALQSLLTKYQINMLQFSILGGLFTFSIAKPTSPNVLKKHVQTHLDITKLPLWALKLTDDDLKGSSLTLLSTLLDYYTTPMLHLYFIHKYGATTRDKVKCCIKFNDTGPGVLKYLRTRGHLGQRKAKLTFRSILTAFIWLLLYIPFIAEAKDTRLSPVTQCLNTNYLYDELPCKKPVPDWNDPIYRMAQYEGLLNQLKQLKKYNKALVESNNLLVKENESLRGN